METENIAALIEERDRLRRKLQAIELKEEIEKLKEKLRLMEQEDGEK